MGIEWGGDEKLERDRKTIWSEQQSIVTFSPSSEMFQAQCHPGCAFFPVRKEGWV